MPRALGVYRESQFSPGKVEADAAILDAVLAHLAAAGIGTRALSPSQFINDRGARCDLIMAMCQGEEALQHLAAAERSGVLVINSPAAIRSCYRDRLGAVLSQVESPVPAGMLVETAAPIDRRSIAPLDADCGIFVKRGDLHALIAEDVRRAGDLASLALILRDFASRGVRFAYLQQAVEGRVVKFYGVTGGGYFTVGDSDAGTPGELMERLHHAAQGAASALGLEVWGGDAIVNAADFKIVDFNDWPSFERVRMQAAAAIAARALELLATGAPV
jgi:hypothetical protein